MDRTVTPAGTRLLEQYLMEPLLDLDELKRRQGAVGEFLAEPGVADSVQTSLRSVRDVQRILGRLQNRIRSPRELGGILAIPLLSFL